jgi:hypothetical protein
MKTLFSDVADYNTEVLDQLKADTIISSYIIKQDSKP